MQPSKKRLLVMKGLFYTLLLIVALVLQQALPALSPWQVRPLTLLPFAILIALFEGAQWGGIYGFLAGMLCDWLNVYTISFYAIIAMILGVIVGIFVEYSMRKNILTATALLLLGLIFVQGTFFLFYLWIPKRATLQALLSVTLPEVLYSVVVAVPLYMIVRLVFRKTTPRRR